MYHETDISVWFIHLEHNRELTYSYTQEREKFYVKQKLIVVRNYQEIVKKFYFPSRFDSKWM